MPGLALDHVQVSMPVGGEAAARDFFGRLLGLNEITKPAELAARGGCWFALGSVELHLGIDADFRATTRAHVALRSDAIADLQQRVTDAGHLAIADTPFDGRARFFTADPFGNRIEFIAA